MHMARRALPLWLPVAGAATVLSFAIYAGVQQAQRSAANDPQIQLAEDAAAALANGASPRDVIAGPQVDMRTSVAPWVVVYAPDGTPLASTASFDGHPPVPPGGLLDDARSGRLDLSWEPVDGLRFAIVAVPYEGGTVVAGRSLRDVEERETRSLEIAALGWLGALVVAAIGALSGVWIRDRGSQPH